MSDKTRATISCHHTHSLLPNQCSSSVVQVIEAPLHLVWALVRQFSNPQSYKQFIKSCELITGNGEAAGSVREVKVVSGLPAGWSIERLELIDDDMHVMVFSIIGGDHRLCNYKSTTTVHEEEERGHDDEGQRKKTVVVESYVVDVPINNNRDEASSFAETIIRCNLRSLASVSQVMARNQNYMN